MLTIRILGPGCANCRKLEQVVRQAMESAKIEAEIVKVTDMNDILAYDIVQTPGLVIGDKIVSSGRVPTPATVAEWILSARGADRAAS